MRQRAQRRRERRFVVETPKLVVEALRSELRVEYVVTPIGSGSGEIAREAEADDVDIFEIDPLAFGRLADTDAPQPALAVVAAPSLALDTRFTAAGDRLVLVLVDVADPGNVGTLIRTAEAAGSTGVITAGATADPLSPKVVRASAGSILRVPIAESEPLTALEVLTAEGFQTVATVLDAAPYDQTELGPSRLAIVLGNEARGLSADVLDRCSTTISIPMAGSVESLNVASAGAVLLFDLTRRKRLA